MMFLVTLLVMFGAVIETVVLALPGGSGIIASVTPDSFLPCLGNLLNAQGLGSIIPRRR
jgi:hypothetical protein